MFFVLFFLSFATAVARIRHLQSLKYESQMLLFILLFSSIFLIVLSFSSDVFVSYSF